MPPKEKTPAEKAAERARILDAALEILATDGYQGLTMRRLGQQIGASATKIYLYFVNKDEVYLSVIIEGYRLLLDDLRQAVAAHTDPEARLDAFFQGDQLLSASIQLLKNAFCNSSLPREEEP